MFVCSDSLALHEKENLYAWSRKLCNFNSAAGKSTNSASVPGISIAMDSRLENGIEMCAELRLRVRMFQLTLANALGCWASAV